MGIHSNMLNMNKWSNSLPSINKIKFNTDPIPDDDNDSLTDVSIIIQTKSSSKNYKTSVEPKPITKPNPTKYDQFVPDDQLFQSLIAYANSFNLEETVYSIHDLKTQLDSTKQPTNNLIRHKSCENIIEKDSNKLIPSNFFSTRKTESDNNDESTTITDGSKFEWEYLSDTIDHSNKSLKKDSFDKRNLQKTSPSPIIIREKTKDLYIRIRRSPTPIIVREILHKPSLSKSSKPPITPKRKIMYDTKPYKRLADEQSKQIIVEYDQINVTIDKNIKQRNTIQQINTYSNKVFRNFLTNTIS